mmetsp:Transcript_50547/g.109062  ORF Transcript_50547/g.109062 Transcript_50547/m.109062 type:complete len:204 (-) Transcript_50547:1986-2597(-)
MLLLLLLWLVSRQLPRGPLTLTLNLLHLPLRTACSLVKWAHRCSWGWVAWPLQHWPRLLLLLLWLLCLLLLLLLLLVMVLLLLLVLLGRPRHLGCNARLAGVTGGGSQTRCTKLLRSRLLLLLLLLLVLLVVLLMVRTNLLHLLLLILSLLLLLLALLLVSCPRTPGSIDALIPTWSLISAGGPSQVNICATTTPLVSACGEG